jgi:adenylylsulfate reductase subunit B
MPLGGAVQPLRSSDAIMWSVKFRDGQVKRFKFPTRTTPEGTAEPDAGFGTATDDLKSPLLRTEPASTGLEELEKI